MEDRELLELLAIHEDLLDGDALEQTRPEEISEVERKALLPLVALAQQMRVALAPVRPSASFRQRLELELVEEARQRMHREMRIASLPTRQDVLIGAAVGSAVVLAGSVAYLVRHYIRGRSQHVEQVGL